MSARFRALLLEQADGRTHAQLTELGVDDLPDGDVLVAVSHSTLNYKDGLAVTGKGKIVRQFPFVPGIDFTGEVVESDNARFKPGDAVILNGFGVGERHWGGFAQRARVKGDWLIKRPDGMSAEQAMAIGTAGYTAALCVLALEDAGITPGGGEIIVTGAGGGVGSVAVTLLAAAGFQVVAVSGRPELEDYFAALGATRTIPRDGIGGTVKGPLGKSLWAGAVDTVGGEMLAKLLAEMNYQGAVAAVGLAGGAELNTTVMPFILRGVRLLGVDSVMAPLDLRERAYRRLVRDLPAEKLKAMSQIEPLTRVPELAGAILRGEVRGRVVIDVNA